MVRRYRLKLLDLTIHFVDARLQHHSFKLKSLLRQTKIEIFNFIIFIALHCLKRRRIISTVLLELFCEISLCLKVEKVGSWKMTDPYAKTLTLLFYLPLSPYYINTTMQYFHKIFNMESTPLFLSFMQLLWKYLFSSSYYK